MSRWSNVTPLASPRVLVLFVCVLGPLFGFGVLAEDVMEKKLFFFDGPILQLMHQHASAMLDSIMIFSSRAGSALVLVPLIVLIAAWLYRRGDRARIWFWLLSTAGAGLLNLLAKYSFARARPTLWKSILPETTYSFPSGHAMASMAVSAALICLIWHQTRWRWFALACAALFVLMVGSSRIYLGVHYPSDVMAGWLASLAWVTGLALLLRLR
jgi:membrane-associated phospholipid phosphatase